MGSSRRRGHHPRQHRSHTLAGIVALCRYVEPLLNESGTVNLPEVIYWDDDTHSSAGGALVNVIAVAVRSLSKGGDHVG
jgi:hypothetical protein